MSDDGASRRKEAPSAARFEQGEVEEDDDRHAPPATRLKGGEAEETNDRAENPLRPASGRPASVREAMHRSRRSGADPATRAPGRRRRRSRPRKATPPPARALTDGPVAETPSREVQVGDEVWSVLLRGSSSVGSGDTNRVRLLSVGLEAPGGRPDPEGTHYLVAQRLDDVDEDVLRGLVARAAQVPDSAPGRSRPAGNPRGRGPSGRRNR